MCYQSSTRIPVRKETQMAAEFFKVLWEFFSEFQSENQLNLPYDFIKQIHLVHQ